MPVKITAPAAQVHENYDPSKRAKSEPNLLTR
jgi:hypothetical protein